MGINLKLFILKLSDNDQQIVHLTDLQKMDKAYQSLASPQVNKQFHVPSALTIKMVEGKTLSYLLQGPWII